MEAQILATLFIAALLCYVSSIWKIFIHNRKLRSIPTIGPSGSLTSYIAALRFLFHGQQMLQEGYDKFHGRLFRVPTLTSWFVVASGSNLIDEIRRAPEDALSVIEAAREDLLLHLTVGPEPLDDRFHGEVVKGPLTRNIGARLADIQEEMAIALEDYIPVSKAQEWTQVTAYSTIMDIVCRASNRMLVGLPLCRDSDWMELNKSFTLDLVKSSIILGFVPAGLRPIVVPLLRAIPKGIRRGAKHLEPLIRERLQEEAQHRMDKYNKPNDVISWMLDVTKDRERDIRSIVRAILMINFASLHTTTMAFTCVLYELAMRPEYVQPLREEIETVIAEGWSMDAVRGLWKVDSFIKECLRVSDLGFLVMRRKVLKDFTFSDGTTIPAGTSISLPYIPVHTDANNYTDPKTFDGFRFEKMRKQNGENCKYQFVSLSIDYLLFGHGRHACTGRFFVAAKMKVLLAYILLKYDVKMADGQGQPKSWQFGRYIGPDTTAKILFRKRREA